MIEGSNGLLASVIIPTYNRQDLLRKTLHSLERNTLTKDQMEVIVSDDGSSDSTFEMVRGFAGSLNIKYIFHEDLGYRLSRVRNLGINQSEGDICIFLDCGLIVPSWFVSAHVDAHRSRAKAVVLGNVYGFSYNDSNTAELEAAIETENIDQSIREFQEQRKFLDVREPGWAACSDDLSKLPAPWALGYMCNVSVARSTLGNNVRFDENYRTWGAEDQDFALSLYDLDCNFVLSREASAIHAPHPKNESQNVDSAKKNKIYMHSKYKRRETELLIGMRSVELNAYLMRERGEIA